MTLHTSAMPSRSVLISHAVIRFAVFVLPVAWILGRAIVDGAAILAALATIFTLIINKDTDRIRTPWVLAGLTLWAYFIGHSLLLATDMETALGRALPWGRWLFLVIGIEMALAQARWRRRFLWWLTAVFGVVIVDTWFQWFTGTSALSGQVVEDGYARLTGPFSKLIVGIYLARLGVLVVGHITEWSVAKTENAPLRVGHFFTRYGLPLLAIAIIAGTVLISGERVAFLLFGLAMTVFFICARGFRVPLMIAGLACIGLIAGALAFDSQLRDRLTTETWGQMSTFASSSYGAVFSNGITVWRTAPIFGVGLKHYRTVCAEGGVDAGYRSVFGHEFNCATHPHNPYLELLAEAGLVGLFLFLVMIGLLIHQIVRRQGHHTAIMAPRPRPNYATLAIRIAPITTLWPLMSSMSLFSNWSAAFTWLLLGLALSVVQKKS